MERNWNSDDKECLAEGTDPGVDDRPRHCYSPSCPVGLCDCANPQDNNNQYPTNNNNYTKKKRKSKSKLNFYRSDLNPPSSSSCYDPPESSSCYSGASESGGGGCYNPPESDRYNLPDSDSYDSPESNRYYNDAPERSRCYDAPETSGCYRNPEVGSDCYGTSEEHGSCCYCSPRDCCSCRGTTEEDSLSSSAHLHPTANSQCQSCQYNNCESSSYGSCHSSQSFTLPTIQVSAKILFGSVSVINNLKQQNAMAQKKS